MKTRKNKPMEVYWINLNSSKERRENMVEVLKDSIFDGMKKHRVEAIDKNQITEKQLQSYFGNVSFSKHTPAEYCCLMSHLKALSQFSKSSSSLALILEDDVSLDFKPYWQESIKDCIHNAPSDWELLQISYIVYNEFPTKMYTPYKTNVNGAISYVVNKKGVIRFLKQFHLDEKSHVADYVLYVQMKTFTYKYPFFVSTLKDSEIHTDHIAKYHLPSKKKLETYLSKQPFPLKQDILFVTAFKNIKRDQVNSRTIETYIKNFIILTKLPYTLVVYVEPEIKKQIPFLHNVIVRDFNEVSTFYDTFLEKDKQIMKSKSYQSKIPENRKMHPEHLYSEYNLINHSKINFISNTKKIYPHYAFYSWIDFGFSGHLKNIPCQIDVTSLPKKVIYQTMNTPIDISEEDMLTKDIVYFAGSAFIVHHSLVEKFEQKWEKKIIKWQKRGITDDDQNLVLQLYLDDPSIFHTVYHKDWRMIYSLLTPSKKLCK